MDVRLRMDRMVFKFLWGVGGVLLCLVNSVRLAGLRGAEMDIGSGKNILLMPFQTLLRTNL